MVDVKVGRILQEQEVDGDQVGGKSLTEEVDRRY